MRISINSPSYKRAGAVGTFKLLPGAWFWVHEFEADDYKKANKGMKIKILPNALRGNVAKVRNHILKAQISKADVTVMVDDDMKSVGYFHNCKRILLKNEYEIRSMIKKHTQLAKDLGVWLWGINVSTDKQNYREYTPFSMTSYISASFSCFLKGNKIFYDEQFPLKEDYDMTAQQCNVKRRVLRINRYYYYKKGAEQPGGCAAYRNVAVEMDQIRLLQKKWGSHIVSFDFNERNHMLTKKRNFDINPIIKIPIRGV